MASDPAADILPAASDTSAAQQAQAEAKRYFHQRGVIHVDVTGNDSGHDLLITLRLVHDAEGCRPFSFLQGSD